jgi:Tfp pilus assembly protein PilE
LIVAVIATVVVLAGGAIFAAIAIPAYQEDTLRR